MSRSLIADSLAAQVVSWDGLKYGILTNQDEVYQIISKLEGLVKSDSAYTLFYKFWNAISKIKNGGPFKKPP